MRTRLIAPWLTAIAALIIQGASAQAVPLPTQRVATPAPTIQSVAHRSYHRGHRHHAKHGHRHHKHSHHHRRSRQGWLPPLKEYRHLPGRWSHAHCKDWHRCHYYFYGYEQWVKWNPEKSRAYFRRHYHH
jgi:hypothetical protein